MAWRIGLGVGAAVPATSERAGATPNRLHVFGPNYMNPSVSVMSDRLTAYTLTGIAAIVAAYVLVILGTSKYGLGMNTDTAAYFSAATNLVEGRGLVQYNGGSYVYYAPLYPVLLAIPVALGAEIGEAARHLHAATFALTVLLAVLWIRRLAAAQSLAVLGVLAVLLALPFFHTWTVVFSEAVFIPLIVASLWGLATYLSDDSQRALWLATACAMLACLSRFAGLPLLMAGSAIILLAGRPSIRRRVVDAALFSIVGSLPTALWVLRNLAVSATTTGARFDEPSTFPDTLYRLLETLGSWFILPRAPEMVRVAVGVGLIGLMGWTLIASVRSAVSRSLDARRDVDGRRGTLLVTSGFVCVYVLFLAWAVSSKWTPSDPSRLLAPILVPLVVGGVVLADAAAARLKTVAVPAIQFVPALVLVLLLAWPVRGVAGSIRYARQHGAGHYSSDAWQRSPLLRHVRASPPVRRLYSNDHNGLHLLARIDSVFPLPSFGVPGTPATPHEALQDFAAEVARDTSIVVVLFTERALDELSYTRTDLESVFELRELSRHADGAIYTLRHRGGVAAHGP